MSEKPTLPPLPEGFKEEMRRLPGIDHDALLRALDTPSSVGVRLNSRKPMSLLFEEAETVRWCPQGKWLASRPKFTLMPQFHAGAFYVQDPSSMIHRTIINRLTDRPVTVLDFCAAPGGKTTAALDTLPDGSVMIANEYEPSRVGALKENIIKWGYPGVAVTNADTKQFKTLENQIDIAIVDAPCSGEGMMRKEPVARTQWSQGLVRQCAALQWEIISNAVRTLKPGGYLVYSTCTFNQTENEEILLRTRDELGMQPVDLNLPEEWGLGPSLADIPAVRFMPHITHGEGLFVGVMRKDGISDTLPGRPLRSKPSRQSILPGADLILEPEGYVLERNGNTVTAVPHKLATLLSYIPRTKTVLAGVELGEIKGKDFIPSAALALSMALKKGVYPEIEVSLSDALAFLRREPLSLPEGTPKGFILVCFDGLPLGWVKNIGTRANNLYPQPWRIRS